MREDIAIRIKKVNSGEIPDGYIKGNIGILPTDWKVQIIEEVLDIQNELRTPISKEVRDTMEGQYPYYGPTQIQGYINKYNVEGPAVLIGEDGDHFLKYKEKEMTLFVDGKYSVNNHAHIVRGTARCRDKWFMYAFQHKNLFNSITRQGAGRYKLTKEVLEKLKIQIPDIEEQDKIILVLEKYNNVINGVKEKIEHKKKQKKWLMQNLLTGIKRLPNFCGEWKAERMENVFYERIEVNCTDCELLSITGNGIVPRSSLEGKDNSSEDKSKYKKICIGDIGYNTMRMWQGVSALSEYEGIVSPAYTVLRHDKNIDAKYFSYLFKLPSSISLFYRYSQGLVDDTRNLKYENFKKIKLSFPSDIEEQKAIAKVLSTADKEIELLQKKLELIKQEKKAMMQLLLTGIVRAN